MSSYIINGGRTLSGEVFISGSKNAALPIIFASLTVRGVSAVSNVPDIADVRVATEILSELGCEVQRRGETLLINADRARYTEPSPELSGKLRASSYLLGASLVRFGRARIPGFGGCNFDLRPIDLHLYAIEALGGVCRGDEICAKELFGADIVFPKKSVGATVNALILASGAVGRTRIFGYAAEPHVFNLVRYLRSSGVKIFCHREYIELEGKEKKAACAAVIPDMIEAGTYLSASLMTDSNILVRGAPYSQLKSFISPLAAAGATFSFSERGLSLRGALSRAPSVETAPYPAFPTDLQPIVAPVFARFFGGSITERVWLRRFGYLSELSRFGIKSSVSEDTAKIYPSEIIPARAEAPDLRGGAALILAALSANGRSEIFSGGIIERGYESLCEKLSALGASVVCKR